MTSNRGLLHSNQSAISLLQRTADTVLIVLALYLSCQLYPQPWDSSYTIASAAAVIAFYLMAEANGLYRSWRGARFSDEVQTALSTWILVLPVLLFLAFITKTSAVYSRVISFTWFLAAPALIILWRLSVRVVLIELRRRGRNSRSVAIAGATPMAQSLAERIRSDVGSGMHVIGLYDDRPKSRRHPVPEELGKVIGNLSQLIEDARERRFDIVYIALPLRAEPRINSIVRRLADTTVTVYVVADFMVFDLLHAQWGQVGDIPVVSIFDSPFVGVGGWLKRLEDIVLSILILLIIALPMAVISVAVKLSSPGPVFFMQRRYGLNGQSIRVLKFRTMSVMEDGGDVKQAIKNDPRVTKLGAFLRRTSLDELPQFFNVLWGDMSIVGPRPHAIAHNELYRSKIHGYMLRHKVKPGITGWAQVNGWRGETDTMEKMEKRIEHDLEYIRNWRLMWDLQIIWLTVFGAKKNQNAY